MGGELTLEKQEDGQLHMILTEAAAAEAAELQGKGQAKGGKKSKSKGKGFDAPAVKGKSKCKSSEERKDDEGIQQDDFEAARIEWLNNLPEDRLTSEEEALRAALVNFLSDWKMPVPP